MGGTGEAQQAGGEGQRQARAGWRPHPLDVLLLAIPVALLARALNWGDVALFFSSGVAIVPLAHYIGVATEELASYVGPAAGGLLNATFGNATELIISFLALRAGLTEVVKASLEVELNYAATGVEDARHGTLGGVRVGCGQLGVELKMGHLDLDRGGH